MKLTLIPNQNSACMRRCATPKTGMDRIYEMVDLITDGSVWASVHIDFLDIGPACDDPAKLAWKANVYDRLRCGETVELDMAMVDVPWVGIHPTREVRHEQGQDHREGEG